MFTKFVARRPLFYAALFVSGLILAARLALPGVYYFVPKGDVSRWAGDEGRPAGLEGRIVSEPEERTGHYGDLSVSFVLACERIDAGEGFQKTGGKARVTAKEPRVVFGRGDRVRLEGVLELPRGRRNPGGFDARDYLDRRGVRAVFFCSKKSEHAVLEKGKPSFWLDEPLRLRRLLSAGLSAGFGEDDAAFLKALLLGERRDIDVEFEELFIRTGTLHLLAVSGFNVGFLCAAVLFLLSPLRLRKNVRLAVLIAAVWAYCLIVGWQAPLVRASVMATLFIAGKMLGRRTDVLNSLGLAALVILAVSPKSFFDVGFQLSFAAVAALALFMPVFTPAREWTPGEKPSLRQRAAFYAEELFWVSFVATFATLPLTVQNFYIVSPASLAANMIVVPLSFLLFFCGVLYFFMFSWMPPAAGFLTEAMKVLMQAFTGTLAWIAEWPAACVTVGRLEWFLAAALTAGILYLFWDGRFRSRGARAAAIALLATNVFLAQEAWRHASRRFEMTALDVGQGDSIYFEFPGGGNMLVDAGRGDGSDQGRRVVVPFLRSRGVRSLDALVVSHPQADHIGGMSAVLKEVRVRNVFDAGKPHDSLLYRRLLKDIDAEKAQRWIAGRGDHIDGFAGIDLDVLHPVPYERSSRDINNDSLVLKLRFRDVSVLLTGDVEAPAVRELLLSGADVRADVLKVAHHGSKVEGAEIEFIHEVSPKFSVISAGRHNPFGHPRPETLEALAGVEGNRILRTDRQGAIRFFSDGRQIQPTEF